MTIKIAINGYGRIDRNILRAKYKSGCDEIHIVAINDLGEVRTNAHGKLFNTIPPATKSTKQHFPILLS